MLTLAGVTLVGCGKNTQAQRDAAKSAADKYCDCVTAAVKLSPADLMKKSDVCTAEDNAFKKAWEGLPDRANNDKEAEATFTYQHGCYSILSDARMAAYKDQNPDK
jgi:hypothetical protein